MPSKKEGGSGTGAEAEGVTIIITTEAEAEGGTIIITTIKEGRRRHQAEASASSWSVQCVCAEADEGAAASALAAPYCQASHWFQTLRVPSSCLLVFLFVQELGGRRTKQNETRQEIDGITCKVSKVCCKNRGRGLHNCDKCVIEDMRIVLTCLFV